MERKSNSIRRDSQGGKESPRIRVKFILTLHGRENDVMQQ